MEGGRLMRWFHAFLMLAVAVVAAGCADINVPAEDPFFKVGHTYRTLEEGIVLFRVPSHILQDPMDYEKEGVFYRVPDEPDIQEFMPELREDKVAYFEDRTWIYAGLFVYIPAGTEFKVNRISYRFLSSLENGKNLEYDLTVFDDLVKDKKVIFYVHPIPSEEVAPGK